MLFSMNIKTLITCFSTKLSFGSCLSLTLFIFYHRVDCSDVDSQYRTELHQLGLKVRYLLHRESAMETTFMILIAIVAAVILLISVGTYLDSSLLPLK